METPMGSRMGGLEIPADVGRVLDLLLVAGSRSWVVGGVLRDHLLGAAPRDWDLATEAAPEEVLRILRPHFTVVPVALKHGTVRAITPKREVEITSLRGPGVEGLLRDLGRRDFTINAMAWAYPDGGLLDPGEGKKDLETGCLRAVGDPQARFREDPLRVLRAARFVSCLGFRVDAATYRALRSEAEGLRKVAVERVRDEMCRLLLGSYIEPAFSLLRNGRLFPWILPEILEGFGVRQNRYHRHDVYRHTIQVVRNAPARLPVRLAALLHDIGKPRVRKSVGGEFRFHGHAAAGAEVAAAVLTRWRLPGRLVQDVVVLVRNHMLLGSDRWSGAAVRRFIRRVGKERLPDLFDLACADRLDHVDPEASLAALDRLKVRVRDELEKSPPLERGELAIDGADVMDRLDIGPGPMVGEILKRVQELVLDDPEKNDRQRLLDWIQSRYGSLPSN